MINETLLTRDEYSKILNVLENFRPIVVDLRFDDYQRKDYRPIKVDNIYGKVYPSFTHYCIDLETGKTLDRRDQYDTIYDLRVKKDNYSKTMTIALLLSCSKCIVKENERGDLESFRSKWIKHERNFGDLDFHNFLLHNFNWIYDHKLYDLEKSKYMLFTDQYNYDRVNFVTGEIYSDHELRNRVKI